MKGLFLFLFTIGSCTSILGQVKGDYNWIFGYYCGDSTLCGTSTVNFSSEPPETSFAYTENWIDITNASMSDEEGNLLFYTNGRLVFNTLHDTMENGEDLNLQATLGWNFAMPIVQGALILPYPGEENLYYVLHANQATIQIPGSIDIVTDILHYSIVDMSLNNGLGKVISKNNVAISDTLNVGKIVATRHANGRDWWVVVPEYNSNRYYRLLITPQGIENIGAQTVGQPTYNGLGQAVFSPDGSKYVHMSLHDWEEGYLDVYDFDRCTGGLSNHKQVFFDDYASTGGVAVSPNSRFLYLTLQKSIYQFDLSLSDIVSSKEKVAEYDGYEELIIFPSGDTFSLETFFFMAQNSPDGKIYITPNNSVKSLHVINRPNLSGTTCEVVQHGFELPSLNTFSLPNFPNYRLGPLDGSPCDTLGLNNYPVARYRYERDAVDTFDFHFTDLSYYEPAEWLWDFGGTGTSTETDPSHLFPGDGTYEVCLMVSNSNGSDTFCRTFVIGTGVSTVENTQLQISVSIFPNPMQEVSNIYLSNIPNRPVHLRLFDALGRPVLNKQMEEGQNLLNLSNLRAGIYYYQIISNDELIMAGKISKI